MNPDDTPDGLLSVPLEEMTRDDVEAFELLRQLAEKHDWEAVGRLLIEHSRPIKREKAP
jgi:hypothetical protein